MERRSILEGVTEHDVVSVHNPMSDPFTVKFGRSVIVSNPQRTIQQTGNPYADKLMTDVQAGAISGGHQAMQHVQQEIPIASGQTLRLPGDLAIVAVRQIVKEMMQRMGAKKQMADPFFIMQYEEKVVLNHESMLKNISVESLDDKLKRQLADLNPVEESKVEDEERAFPTESTGNAAEPATSNPELDKTARRSPGRPRSKAD